MGVRICLGCINEVPSEVTRCPICGFSLTDAVAENALEPKTVLKKRYVLGKVIKQDGEGFTYISYDLEHSGAVLVREYYPENLVIRSESMITPVNGQLAKFKALMTDFTELFMILKGMHTFQNLRTVHEIFEENGTTYAVLEYLDCYKLTKFLNEQAGELDWEDASRLFRPLIETLAEIHRRGIIHRGMSPENIMMTTDGRLVLTGFSICSANVVNSEIKATLAEGYAAPEQYTIARHGEWTDVYAICAVLYKVLTGTRPPSAPSREVNDNLITPDSLNETIPPQIADAIMDGLEYEQEHRFQNMDELLHALYYTTPLDPRRTTHHAAYPGYGSEHVNTEATQYFDRTDEHDMRSQKQSREDKLQWERGEEAGKEKKPVWLKVLIASLPVVFVLCLVLYQVLIGFPFFDFESKKDKNNSSTDSSMTSSEEVSSEESSEEVSEEPEVPKTAVNSFVGLYYDDINLSEFSGKYKFENPVYEYNSQFAAGTVCAQSVKDGTMVTADEKITLTISKGPKIVNLPSAQGLTPSEYADRLLTDYDITTTIQKEYSDKVTAGYVSRIDPAEGSSFDRSTGAQVTIYQSMGPDPTTESEQAEPEIEE